jgi:hypothetical protein
MGLISAERRMNLVFGFYVIALFLLVDVFAGSVAGLLLLVVMAEILFTLWRPTPKLGPTSYQPPMPAGWEMPVRLLRGYELVSGCWSLVVGFVVVTAFFGFVLFVMRPKSFGTGNWVVLAVIAIWLITRWVWAPPLYRAIARQIKGVGKELAQGGPTVTIGADGFDIDFKVQRIGGGAPRRPWVFHLAFAELDEVRTLDSNDAQAYWQSMEQYDPTLLARAAYELYRTAQGQIARPSIYQQLGVGNHLLMRGPTVLYLFGVFDETGPAVVAAWQQWRTVHPQVVAQ